MSANENALMEPRAPGALAKPNELSAAAAEAARQLIHAGQSGNTLRSYAAAWRYWLTWFELRYGTPLTLPVSVETVVQFIVDHAGRSNPDNEDEVIWELPEDIDQALVDAKCKAELGPMAMNTLRHRLSVLSKMHTLKKLPNPMSEGSVRELVRRTGAAYKLRKALPVRKPPLRVNLLQAMLDTCDNSPAGVRDRALLLFAFASGGRRRSEVADATLGQIQEEGRNYTFNLFMSKSNQTARDSGDNYKPITGEAATALRAWLELSEALDAAKAAREEAKRPRAEATGALTNPVGKRPATATAKAKAKGDRALFRRLHRGGVLGESLSADGLNQIVKRRVKLAQAANPGQFLTVDWEALSAHSLRSGFVTESDRMNVPTLEAMAMTGHKTMTAFTIYNRAAKMDSRAARVFDEAKGRNEEQDPS